MALLCSALRYRSAELAYTGLLPLLVVMLAGCAVREPLGGVLLRTEKKEAYSSFAVRRQAHFASEGGERGYASAAIAGRGMVVVGPGELEPAADAPSIWHEDRAKDRARELEELRVWGVAQPVRQQGNALAARRAEAERVIAQILGVCSGIKEVGTELTFSYWSEGGVLTLVGYHDESGEGHTGGPANRERLIKVLRLILLGESMLRHTGEVILRLKREEANWAVAHEVMSQGTRPAEARTLPISVQGTPASAFLTLHEAAKKWLRTVEVRPGGAARGEYVVRLEDGRLVSWELREFSRTHPGRGVLPLALPADVTERVTRVLLPFMEGLGPRAVRLVLLAEHRSGDAEARGRVLSASVERTPLTPELSWYRAMHEATLLRWREGMVESSAWLAQKGVEEMALWFVGGMVAHGASFFALQGLKQVPRALGGAPKLLLAGFAPC